MNTLHEERQNHSVSANMATWYLLPFVYNPVCINVNLWKVSDIVSTRILMRATFGIGQAIAWYVCLAGQQKETVSVINQCHLLQFTK